MPGKKADLIQETVDLPILKTIAHEPLHGYGIAQRILLTSKGTLHAQQGSIFRFAPAAAERSAEIRMERVGQRAVAKYYSLTASGRKSLLEEEGQWQHYADAIALVPESQRGGPLQFGCNRIEAELELAHHLRQLAAEYEHQGHSREEAMRMARREFGGPEQVKERCGDEWRWAWFTGIRQDIAFALRQMRRSPGLALTAVLTLAPGNLPRT